jgi:hypothetical protein
MEDTTMAEKKLRSRVTQQDRRTKQNATGPNRGKTRSDVPSTPTNKAASGKQTSNKGRRR